MAIEVIAGMMDRDEDPEQVAIRELMEEAGVEAKLLPICDYLVSVGGSDERMYMYCGFSISPARGCFWPRGEERIYSFMFGPTMRLWKPFPPFKQCCGYYLPALATTKPQ